MLSSTLSSTPIIWIGMDVHKDTVMVAVFEGQNREAEIVQQLPNEDRKLRRFFERWSRRGEIRSCYEASGAGYVLHRAITEWGYDCEIIAPSLIPIRPGERRKHDRKDATQLARLYRAGELVTIRIPSVAEEQVRDLVRCRQCFQREILRSRGVFDEIRQNTQTARIAARQALNGPRDHADPECLGE